MTIEIAVLEDDRPLRDRYVDLIGAAGDMRLAWAAGTVAEAQRALPSVALDVLLTDLGLPDGNGLEIIRTARQRYPRCEVMVISVFGDEESVVTAIEAGASGYLLKDTLADAFLATIRELHAGGSPISPSIARILLNRARPSLGKVERARNENTVDAGSDIGLGEREAEILTLVAKGFNFSEIGRMLGISVNTVKTHIYRVYQKLSVHSRSEAVYEATRMGLLDC
jgi:DNA-binding NarL/FixJ family response regulator